MATFVWLLLLVTLPIALAYWRANLLVATGALGVLLAAYAVLGHGGPAWNAVWGALFALLLFLNLVPLRRALVGAPLLGVYRRMLPSMSKTEQDALEAGNVWWEGELFAEIGRAHV